MPVRSQRTTQLNVDQVEREWLVVDAADQSLGRLATKIATVLMGKHKPTYTPHVDTGDFVIVTNCEKIKVTGRKLEQRTYNYYTGYPGGLKRVPWAKIREERPEQLVELAVRRMLPKNAMGRRMLKKLKAYQGTEHPHGAQQPKSMATS